jgi:hypothetical protein
VATAQANHLALIRSILASKRCVKGFFCKHVQKNFSPVIINANMDNECNAVQKFYRRSRFKQKFSVDSDGQKTLISCRFLRFMFFARNKPGSRCLTYALCGRCERNDRHHVGAVGKINRLLRRNRVFCVVL